MVIDSKENIFFTESDTYKIKKITPDGKVSTFVETLDGKDLSPYNYQYDLEIDSKDNLFVLQDDFKSFGRIIKKITPNGQLTNFFQNKTIGFSRHMSIDKDDNIILISNGNGLRITSQGELLKSYKYISLSEDIDFVVDSTSTRTSIEINYDRRYKHIKIQKHTINNTEVIIGDEFQFYALFPDLITIDSNDNVYFVVQSLTENRDKELTFIYQITPYNIVLPKFVGYFSSIYSLSIDKRKNILYLASKASIYKVKL
jgi:hypothetical protein